MIPPTPLYDDVYREGLAWLDSLAGPDLLHGTEWAMRFKENCPGGYDEAIAYASQHPVVVNVEVSTELEVPMVAIIPVGTDFWLDAFPTKEEAIELCEKMGWEIND